CLRFDGEPPCIHLNTRVLMPRTLNAGGEDRAAASGSSAWNGGASCYRRQQDFVTFIEAADNLGIRVIGEADLHEPRLRCTVRCQHLHLTKLGARGTAAALAVLTLTLGALLIALSLAILAASILALS